MLQPNDVDPHSTASAYQRKVGAHSCSDAVWLLVCDNGCGMSAATRARAYRGTDLGMAHGTGLSRIRQFMTASGGDLRIRSHTGVGTCIGLRFPAPQGPLQDLLRADQVPGIPLAAGHCEQRTIYPVAA